MRIDVTTLYCLIVGTTVIGASLTAWQRQLSSADRGALDFWAVGQLLAGLGCLARMFHAELPHFVAIGLSNLALIVGYAIITAGMMRFADIRVPRRFLLANVSAALGWLAWGQYASLETRIVTTALVVSVLCALAALALRERDGSRPLLSQRLMQAMLMLHGLFFLGRAGVTFAGIEGGIAFTGTNFAVTMLEGVLWSAFLPAGLLSMVREKRERALITASETDFLTGVHNRRAFMGKAERLLGESDAPAAVAVFDLDHFKVINDRHGHAIGDEALRVFCRVAENEIALGDIFGRLGGEEFAAVFRDCDGTQAQRLAATILQRYTAEVAYRFVLSLPATASAGIAEAGRGADLAQLLREADRALYEAKTNGRDQAVIADARPVSSLPETRAA